MEGQVDPKLLSALIGALVGGTITMIGWVVNHFLSRKRELEAHRRETAKGHLERQMEELYGPLLGLINQSQAVYDAGCLILPVKDGGGVNTDQFSEEHWAIWDYLASTYFIPINQRMSELLHTKIYLVESVEIPHSFQEFTDHQVLFEMVYRLWKERRIPSKSISGRGWPKQFNKDAEASLERLRSQYQKYL